MSLIRQIPPENTNFKKDAVINAIFMQHVFILGRGKGKGDIVGKYIF